MIALCLLALLADGSGLVAQAEARRVAAEGALAALRAQRLTAHQTLLEQLEAAQAGLNAARARLETAAATRESAAQAERLQVADEARLSKDLAQRRSFLLQITGLVELPAEEHAAIAAVKAGLDARLDRVAARRQLQVAPEPVFDRHGQLVTVPILRLGAARTWAAGGEPATTGLVSLSDDGQARIGGPALSPHQIADLQAAASGAPRRLPFDVSGQLAQVEDKAGGVAAWIAAGGVFIWPIVALGLLAALLLPIRALAFTFTRVPGRLTAGVLTALRRGELELATRMAPPRSALARVLAAQGGGDGRLEAALVAEEPRLEAGLKLLTTIAALAPLVGLLGTISGLIGTFDVIAVHGTGEPRLLSGGIAEALVTTELGLIVAIPTLLGHALLARVAERRRLDLEEAATLLAGAARDA